MSDFVKAQNFSSQLLKSFTDDGQAVTLQPRGMTGAVKPMTQEEYEALRIDYGDLVGLVNQNDRSLEAIVPQLRDEVWVANMTGNPDAPKKVEGYKTMDAQLEDNVDVYRPGEPREIIVQNIGRKEINISQTNGIELMKTIPGREIRLAPYQQKKLLRHEANEFLNQELQTFYAQRGSLMESRDIGPLFKPDFDSWTLDEMRELLSMFPEAGPSFPAGREVMGDDEEAIKAANVGDKRAYGRALFQAKEDCFNRITLRLFNPSIKAPTQKQYEQFVSKKAPKAEVERPKAKKEASSDFSELLRKNGV